MYFLEKSPWTEDRIAELTVMIVSEKKSAGQCVEAFDARGFRISRNAVIGKMNRLGLRSLYTSERRPNAVPREKKRSADTRVKLPPPRRNINVVPKIAPDPFIPPVDLEPAPTPLRTPLIELSSLQCHCVLDERGEKGMPLYCGHPAPNGQWCEYHYKRMHYSYRRAS